MTAEEQTPYTEPPENTPPEQSAIREARFPSMMLVLTFLYLGAVFLAFRFSSKLDDSFAVGLDVIMVASMASGTLLILLWIGWFLFFSRWRWTARILASIALISMPVLFVKIFRPVLGGDVTIQRFEPIWETQQELPAVEQTVVDLTSETPNDFPRFLGPTQDSTAPDGFLVDGTRLAEAKVLWKQPIGEGWSGFAARNGFAVTMEQRQNMECVTCYSIDDGSLQWLHAHPVRHRDAMNLGRVGPRATPTIHEGLVYAIGAVGHFVCLNGSDGTVAWEVDLNELLGIELTTAIDGDGQTVTYEGNTRLAWGRSGAALIVDDLVVIPGGGPIDGEMHSLLAFDRRTGELRWKGGDEMIAYGSPTLANVAGVDQILMTCENFAMGFDPESGKALWKFARPGKSDGEANTSQLTVVSADQVLTSKGYPDGGGELIQLTNADGQLSAKSLWNNTRALKTKLMSPVILNGHAYSLSNGFLECAGLSDGERIWKHRGRFGHGQMLLAGEDILLISESGELLVFHASPEKFEEVGTLQLIDGVCWNTLCVYGNKLLIRSEIEAACVELPTK